MNQNRLRDILLQFSSKSIAIIGDFFLDKYLDFDPDLAEISIETGKTANQVVNIRRSPGAAGTVACNLSALGAGKTLPIGFTGDDGEGYDLRKGLNALGCDCSGLFVCDHRHTPTYLKPQNIRVKGLAGESERYDTKNRLTLPESIENTVIAHLDSIIDQIDAVIVMDQADEPNCGIISDRVRTHIIEIGATRPDLIFWTDSRHRAGLFSNVVLKCNAKEALVALSLPVEDQSSETLIKTGKALSMKTNRPVFLTRGEDGMIVFDKDYYESVRSIRLEGPVDPTGAGDSATASAVLSLCSGASLAEAALIANLVASITVQKLGETGTASPSDLPARLKLWIADSGM